MTAAGPTGSGDSGASPDVAAGNVPGHESHAGRRAPVPRSFQARLTFAFIGVVALTLGLVAPVVINRLDEYFRVQEEQGLVSRAEATSKVLVRFISYGVGTHAVLARLPDGTLALNPEVKSLLVDDHLLTLIADYVAQADVRVTFGPARRDIDGVLVVDPSPDLAFLAALDIDPPRGQARDPAITPARTDYAAYATMSAASDWGMSVVLSNPYTSRASTLAAITGLLLIMGVVAFLVAMLVAAFVTHRFTTPLTRLTDASRRLAEGDFSSRVPADELATGTLELRALSLQFNTMADRLEESVAIIRRDRDYSREFLADVSHELRTPIAAMHTFIELLQGPAGRDPAARAEFLESSAVQLDRLDWLAQNLLDLSKLESGLVLLDLRPEDVRGTIESAVEQHLPSADRRGIRLTVDLPGRPLRIRHDGPRVGQVIGNLVGNALKFTPRGGSVSVLAQRAPDGGARIEVADTGVGIQPSELPRIFDRFYRGSEANEARGAGSGLGLSIVKSIVDMHHGTIAVESRVGSGSRFVVTLPPDPRQVVEPSAGDGGTAKVNDSSPSQAPAINVDPAPLETARVGPAASARSPQERRPSQP